MQGVAKAILAILSSGSQTWQEFPNLEVNQTTTV